MPDPPIRVLVVDDHGVVREGLRTYLELQDGIEVAGEALLDTAVAARLVDAIAAPEPDLLTPREREVLALVARGMSNKRIARELGLAEKTVKTHVSHVLAKLGAADRTEAAEHAVREGLIGRKT